LLPSLLVGTQKGNKEQLLLVTFPSCGAHKGNEEQLLLVTFVCPHKKERSRPTGSSPKCATLAVIGSEGPDDFLNSV